jgi:hypothetical protein
MIRASVGSNGTKRWVVGVAGALVLLGVVALGTSLQGCGGDHCGAAGAIHARWALTQGGQTVQCLAGDQVLMRVDNDSMVFTFDCSDYEGLTTAIGSGYTHNVAFQLQDAGGNLLSQTNEMSLFVPCGATQDTPVVVFALATP